MVGRITYADRRLQIMRVHEWIPPMSGLKSLPVSDIISETPLFSQRGGSILNLVSLRDLPSWT